jgi:hypothetical protein
MGNLSAASSPAPPQLYVIKWLWADLAEYIPQANSTAYRRRFYRQQLGIAALGPQSCVQADSVIKVLQRRVKTELERYIIANI